MYLAATLTVVKCLFYHFIKDRIISRAFSAVFQYLVAGVYKSQRLQVAVATKFCTVAPNVGRQYEACAISSS